ncbi:MAG: hypothetical protein ABMA01_17295, partial [Chthoniobacteraceae bacterium]
MRLVFISNSFPDGQQPDHGLDSVSMLHALADRWEIRAVVPRPVPPGTRGGWHPRAADVAVLPAFVAAPRIPLLGRFCDHRLCARALRKPLANRRAACFLPGLPEISSRRCGRSGRGGSSR